MESDPVVNFEREYAFYQIVPDNQGRAGIKVLPFFSLQQIPLG